MKAATKKTIIIVAPILAVLAITILVLSLVTVKPINQLEGYKSLYVMEDATHAQSDYSIGKVEKGLPTLKFSIMRALLEGNLDFSIKPVETKNSEGNTVYKTIAAADFLSLRPGYQKYMLCFDYGYGSAKTNKNFKNQDGSLIIYDRLIMVIETPNGDLQSVKLYPYVARSLEPGLSNVEPNEKGEMDSRYYKVYEFSAKMYTTRLYEILTDAGFAWGGSSAEII